MWRKEFDESYAVPDVIDQHPELVDVSWHNDASPSFAPRGLQNYEDICIRLFVQHPDPAMREFTGGESGRFIAYADADGIEQWDGDDADEAITALLRIYATWRAANPVEVTTAKEAQRKARQAAEDAANNERARQHADAYPSGCPQGCAQCVGRVTYGLTVGSEFIITNSNPWRGPERRGTEAVTMRARVSCVREGGFEYVGVRILDVTDPLPGGANDGDKWRTRGVSGHAGGMTWSYAFTLCNTLALRKV